MRDNEKGRNDETPERMEPHREDEADDMRNTRGRVAHSVGESKGKKTEQETKGVGRMKKVEV